MRRDQAGEDLKIHSIINTQTAEFTLVIPAHLRWNSCAVGDTNRLWLHHVKISGSSARCMQWVPRIAFSLSINGVRELSHYTKLHSTKAMW